MNFDFTHQLEFVLAFSQSVHNWDCPRSCCIANSKSACISLLSPKIIGMYYHPWLGGDILF